MFSNAGFVGGQQQQIQQQMQQQQQVWMTQHPPPASRATATTTTPMIPPSPPVTGQTQLDWLIQDEPARSDEGFGYDNTEDPNTPPAWFGNANGYYNDNNIILDNDVDNDEDVYEDEESNNNVHYDERLGSMSQQYQKQGLDMLSGGLDGFGAVKGIEKVGGDMNHRGNAADVKVPGGGVVGNVGVTMGGDFNSSSNVGNGPRRSSARYSGGGDYSD
jgi:hypothetical protein